MSGGHEKPRRPIFLDGGRTVKPTIWRRLGAALQTRAKYFRVLFFIASWLIILSEFFFRHYIAGPLAAIALGLVSIFIWDAFQAKRELKRMRLESEFLVWFDRVNAIAAQYNLKFFGTPVWRQHFRNALTPEEAFERSKPGAERAIGKLGRSKITRLKGSGTG